MLVASLDVIRRAEGLVDMSPFRISQENRYRDEIMRRRCETMPEDVKTRRAL